MARSNTAARISARSWNDLTSLCLALERGLRWASPTCWVRDSSFEVAPEARDTGHTASGTLTYSWKVLFLWAGCVRGDCKSLPIFFHWSLHSRIFRDIQYAASVSLSGVTPHQFRCGFVGERLRTRRGRMAYVTYYDFDGAPVVAAKEGGARSKGRTMSFFTFERP